MWGGTERNRYIDLIKGMGIVLMVIRHARAPFSDFVLLFHMALFFIASGFLVNCSKIKTLPQLVSYYWKKIKGLYFPCVSYSILFICLNNVFLRWNFYTDNPEFLNSSSIEATYKTLSTSYTLRDIITNICKTFLFKASTQMGGAFWFFQTLLFVLVMYATVGFVLNRCPLTRKYYLFLQGFVALIFLCVGYCCSLTGSRLHGFNRASSVYVLIFLGNYFKERNLMERILCNSLSTYITIVVSCAILGIGYHRGYIALDGNHIENPVFFLVMSCSGWFLMYGIAVLMEKHKTLFGEILIYISKHSVPIIALHFVCFKFVNIYAVKLLRLPSYMIAAFPVLMTEGIWWLLYVCIGILIPLAVDRLLRNVKQRLFHQLERIEPL